MAPTKKKLANDASSQEEKGLKEIVRPKLDAKEIFNKLILELHSSENYNKQLESGIDKKYIAYFENMDNLASFLDVDMQEALLNAYDNRFPMPQYKRDPDIALIKILCRASKEKLLYEKEIIEQGYNPYKNEGISAFIGDIVTSLDAIENDIALKTYRIDNEFKSGSISAILTSMVWLSRFLDEIAMIKEELGINISSAATRPISKFLLLTLTYDEASALFSYIDKKYLGDMFGSMDNFEAIANVSFVETINSLLKKRIPHPSVTFEKLAIIALIADVKKSSSPASLMRLTGLQCLLYAAI